MQFDRCERRMLLNTGSVMNRRALRLAVTSSRLADRMFNRHILIIFQVRKLAKNFLALIYVNCDLSASQFSILMNSLGSLLVKVVMPFFERV